MIIPTADMFQYEKIMVSNQFFTKMILQQKIFDVTLRVASQNDFLASTQSCMLPFQLNLQPACHWQFQDSDWIGHSIILHVTVVGGWLYAATPIHLSVFSSFTVQSLHSARFTVPLNKPIDLYNWADYRPILRSSEMQLKAVDNLWLRFTGTSVTTVKIPFAPNYADDWQSSKNRSDDWWARHCSLQHSMPLRTYIIVR